MTLSDLSIKRPVFAWMLMAAMILFGALGFSRMGISQLPDVDFPVLNISVNWEGAAPEVVETEVTDVIEDAVMQVQGVHDLSSSSKQGSSNVTVEFDLNKDIDVAVQEVQTKLAQAQRNLPQNIDTPIVSKSNPEDQPILWLAVSGDRPAKDIMALTRDVLKDKFTTVPGVGEVFLGGYVEPNLRVWLKADEMSKRELTVDDVINAIQTQHAEVPAGYIDEGKQELNVRVLGEAATPEDFANIVIAGRSGSPIYKTIRLGDIATIEDGLDDVRRISRVGGKPAVGLGIRKQRGSNAVEVAHLVKQRMAEVAKVLPKGVDISVNFDSTKFIEDSTHELTFELCMAAVLTSLVCWMFLGSWSAALNIILAIPTSIVGSFLLLYFFGFTLNTFTLLGLTLVVGIVVDDAIMVLENIVRHREMGESKVRAALVGAREIYFAAMAASAAILAIFAPVVFMKGIIGRYFFQFGITISVAVALSLLEALTLAPMRCSQFLEVGHSSWLGSRMEAMMSWGAERYRGLLRVCLNFRWTVILVALVFFGASISLVKYIKKEFVPSQDQGRLMVRMQTDPGSSLDFTNGVVAEAEKVAMGRKDVDHYFAAIGGFGGADVTSGMMFLTLKDKKDRALSQSKIQAELRGTLSKIPGMQRAIVQDMSLSGFTAQRGFPVEFSLRGDNWDNMAQLSETLRKKMMDSGYMVDVDTDYRLGQPEIKVVPNRLKAGARGVSVQAIGNTINSMIGGIRVGKYTKGGRRYDVRVRLVEADRRRPEDIDKIWVRNNRGEVIRLSEVIDRSERKTLLSITRKNRERAISMFANVAPGKSQGEALEVVKKLGAELPEGYRIVLSGSAQTFNDSFSSLTFALIFGIAVAYMVLASQFNSFIHPVTVLMALPFSVTGAFIALKLGGASLNIYSMIGLILLMGIVKKNSILLVDFTNQRRNEGLNVRDAIEDACPMRFRPILMTSIATVTAAIPPALGLGPGAETRTPMALVVIGGVFVSTFLTLFVVPCVYSLFSRLESTRHDDDLKDALRELGELPEQRNPGSHVVSPTHHPD